MVIVGTLVGALGGVLLLVLRRGRKQSEQAQGMTVGALLFFGSCLAAWASGRITLGLHPTQLVTLGVVAVLFVLYGVCMAALLRRFERLRPGEESN